MLVRVLLLWSRAIMLSLCGDCLVESASIVVVDDLLFAHREQKCVLQDVY